MTIAILPSISKPVTIPIRRVKCRFHHPQHCNNEKRTGASRSIDRRLNMDGVLFRRMEIEDKWEAEDATKHGGNWNAEIGDYWDDDGT